MTSTTTLGTVLVTGGASGLGAAVVQAVADAGGRPVSLDIAPSEADVEQELVDLSDARAAEDAVRRVSQRVGGLDAVVRAALPDLLERHGHVVTVASTLGIRALSDATAYSASKFGVVGFTRALAAETQGRMGTTMLVPGGMHTHFFDDRDEQYKPPPDAKLNQPADVARAVLFALQQPPGCEVRELVVTPSIEGSWP
jgi:NADP-dependent 3-hydroxy acid dehydrogenase YdfG